MPVRIVCGVIGAAGVIIALVFIPYFIWQGSWSPVLTMFASLYAGAIFANVAYRGVAPGWFEDAKLNLVQKK